MILTTAPRGQGKPAHVQAGTALPFGAGPHGDGVNFSVFSRHAAWVWLELFDSPEDEKPARIIELDPSRHRTGDVWHVWVQGVVPGCLYAYRLDGPYLPEQGYRFNRHKMLLDPYAKAITGRKQWNFGITLGYDRASPEGDLSLSREDDAGAMPKCIVTHDSFDWQRDQPLRIPWSETIVYETHLRGFTIHPCSGVAHPGTAMKCAASGGEMRDSWGCLPAASAGGRYLPGLGQGTGTSISHVTTDLP